mgnify:CR=1 FL=1
MADSPKVIDRDGYRQELLQYQEYASSDSTPSYVYHKAEEDRLMILCSQIKIWQPKGTEWFDIPAVDDCLCIREVNSIEISKSYKDVISTAVVKIPRGTVVSMRNKKANVKQGDKETGTENDQQTVEEATQQGDLMTVDSARYLEDGTPTASLAPNYDDKGLVEFNRTEQEVALLEPGDMAIGNRIEIRLGYAYSEEEFERIKAGEGKDLNLDLVFTGFITGISVGTPLEIECENMAHLLTTFSIPKNITDKTPLHVVDFLGDDGKYKLLKDTGLELTESTKQCVGDKKIDVRGAAVSDQMSVVDVIDLWRKQGVMSYMVDDNATGVSKLRVARIYYAGPGGTGMPTNEVEYITYNGGDNVYVIIQADWDVASDDLGLMHTDKKYLAVEAEGKNKDGNWFKLTVIKRPDIEDEGWAVDSSGQFYISNEREYKPRKARKRSNGSKNTMVKQSKLANKISMKRYNVVPYISTKLSITRDELVKEAISYWRSYVPNGIEGSITIFGELDIQPAQIIGLVDQRQPEKNGYYLVESVDIDFGQNGYRKKLKLPYKLASFGGAVTTII